MTLIGTVPVGVVLIGQPILFDGRPTWFYGAGPAGDAPGAPLRLDLQARDSDGWGWDFTAIVPTDYRAVLCAPVDAERGSFQ